MLIEDFGARVVSVWQGLRPATRSLVERAVGAAQQAPSAAAAAAAAVPGAKAQRAGYDACSEWELSRLLAALDERAAASGGQTGLSGEQASALGRMAETCARVLHREARSAEVFGQLLERALRARDYVLVDALADALAKRLAPSETCELVRHENPSVRALAHEALLQMPVGVLVRLLGDPVDAEVARDALEHQADEFESEEARWVVCALDAADSSPDDI
jgi:hypothetical protein